MKKLLLLSTLLIFACTEPFFSFSIDEDNPCIYTPALTTEAVIDITETTATLNGVISVVSINCEVATGEMQGFVYSTNPSPTNDDNVEVIYGTNISTNIESLEPNTTYYVRALLTNTIGEFYGNEVDFTTNEENVAIGQIYQGGIIVYVDSTGQHGLIAATEDQSSGIQWYNGTNILIGATGTAIGTGLTNTNAIIAAQGSGSYAASIARAYNDGGYPD